MKTERARVWAALLALYFIWGSTFLGIRIALEGIPPLLLSGFRYLTAGAILYGIARLRGEPRPALREWKWAAVVGPLLVAGNAFVVVAEQWVASGLAAVALASEPIWIALIAGLFGRWPTRNEWVGLAIGMAGVAVLETAGDLRASPLGAVMLALACGTWALGSVLSSRLPLRRGLITSASQMMAGGAVMLLGALARGEHLASAPPARAALAFVYLIVFGSIIGYTSYQFLLVTVRPALAASYAYVNPLVALALGAAAYGEHVAPRAVGALVLILGGVGLLAWRAQAARAAAGVAAGQAGAE